MKPKKRESLLGPSGQPPPLNERERAIMEELATGLLYKEIADRLAVTVAVVKKHQHRVFAKLGVSNRTEAVVRWYATNQK